MFAKIYLEITNACNLSCSFCPPTRRKPEFLSKEDFELFLRKLGGFGRLLYFHLKGEPLLHPLLGDFLRSAGEREFSVSITTNGTLLAEKASLLLEATNLRKLSISLHSHAGSPDAEAYWRGVAAFLDEHRAKPAFPVSLRLWNRSSGTLPPETERLWALLRDRYPEAGTWETASGEWEAKQLDHLVYLNQAERYEWPSLSLPQAETRGFCRGLRNQIGILCDGTVVPCCLDGEGEMNLGNLRGQSLGAILDSPRAQAIYEGFSMRRLVEPLCRSCGYRRKFSSAGESSRKY